MKDVSAFLKQMQWITTSEEMMAVEDEFVRHMEMGLQDKGGSLPMIPAYLTVDALPMNEQTLIVMDAGGTNLRVSLLKLKVGEAPQILRHEKTPMPGHNGTITREAFFDAMAEAVAPLADMSDRIGFCFSFPVTILPSLDGEILYLDKEISVDGINGSLVGEGLREALARRGVKHDHRIVILNDTVAALLGALAEHPADGFGGFIGMILGTGTNCCYSELNAKITKNETLRDLPGHSIINMEAGHFNALTLTRADLMVSRGTLDPKQNLSEKMMSGAYLGKLLGALLTCAAEDGLLSTETGEKLKADGAMFQTRDISFYTEMPTRVGRLHDIAANEEDAQVIYALTDALLDRAAMLAVMNLTGIMRYTGTGRDPLKPVAIAIEGTTYARCDVLRRKIHALLVSEAEKKRGFYCRVFSTDEANLIGSAIAAMTI